jgi:DNA-binding GntR family transcriptional regulator
MNPLPYKTLRENVVSAIRMKILSRELTPGMRINEQNLSEKLRVSRGPIREALRQLEHEGLVEYVRNAGCSVRTITVEDVYEIYLLRCNYEMMAIKICDGHFTEEEFAQMEKILEQMRMLQDGETDRMIRLDHELHRLFVAKAGLPRMQKAWEELNYESMIASVNCGSYQPTLAERQYKIHHDLIMVCRSGNHTDICQAIYSHYMQPIKKVIAESGLKLKDFYFFDEAF